MTTLDVIHQIGVPFLFWLVVAILLVASIVWRVWRASPRFGKWLALLILLAGGTFALAKSLSPSGKYAVGGCKGPGLQSFGISDEYYELSNGVFYHVVDGRIHRIGSYRKKDGQWIVETDGGGPFAEQKLRFSILGFYMVLPAIEGNEGGPTAFNRRRLVSFTRPSWIPEWLE
jgi:energy-coupling factor transporter transmembrane protein EcfT